MNKDQPLNCQIHKAVEDVNRYLATDKTAKVADICGMMNPAIAYIMRHGSHFVLDASIADMVERDRNNVCFTFPVHLPYSVISLEHDVKFPTNEEMTEFEPGRQITVFTEIELTDRQMELYEGVRRNALEAFCFIRNTKLSHQWVLQPVRYTILIRDSDGKTGCVHPSLTDYFMDDMYMLNWYSRRGEAGMIEDHAKETCLMARYLYFFLSVLNCNNVEAIRHYPPANLQKKRKHKGAIPLFTYRTLHIKSAKKEVAANGFVEYREGPRLHFRRGHVRHLQSGETTWVTQCMVGDASRGEVKKEYKVSAV